MAGKLKSFYNSTLGEGDEIKSFLFANDNGALTSTVDGGKTALDVNIAASDIQIEVDLSHVDDSVRLGDGTDLVTTTTVGGDVGLDVNIINASIEVSATDLDIRDLAFATDSVDVSGSEVSISGDVNVTQGTDPWIVSATDLDIRDLDAAQDSVASWAHDGAGNAIGSRNDALKVSQAASAIVNGTIVISNTATQIAAAADQERVLLQNLGNTKIYVGSSAVAAGDGWEVDKNEFLELPLGADLYAITASGSTAAGAIRFLKLSA
jgi:hypothetical protein